MSRVMVEASKGAVTLGATRMPLRCCGPYEGAQMWCGRGGDVTFWRASSVRAREGGLSLDGEQTQARADD